MDDQHADPMFDAERVARSGIDRLAEDIGAPRSAMVPLFEALTGKPVAHLLPPDRERPDGEGDKAPASA